MLGASEEINLALEVRDRLGMSSLKRSQVAGPDVPTGDEQSFAARQEGFLQLHRLLCCSLASREFADERRAVGKLQRVPASLGISVERSLVPVGGLSEARESNEECARHGTQRSRILRLDGKGTANRGHS